MTFHDNLFFIIYHINISPNKSDIAVISELTNELGHSFSLTVVGKGKLYLDLEDIPGGQEGKEDNWGRSSWKGHTALNVASGYCAPIYGLVLIHSCPEMKLDFLCARWVLNSKYFNLKSVIIVFSIKCVMSLLATRAQCPSKPREWIYMQTCSLCSDCPQLIRLSVSRPQRTERFLLFYEGFVPFYHAVRALPLRSWERQRKRCNTAGLFIPSMVLY